MKIMTSDGCKPDTVVDKLPSEIFDDSFSEGEGMIGNSTATDRDNLANNR